MVDLVVDIFATEPGCWRSRERLSRKARTQHRTIEKSRMSVLHSRRFSLEVLFPAVSPRVARGQRTQRLSFILDEGKASFRSSEPL